MEPRLLDCIALTADLPESHLTRGQVGTIVEELAPDVYLVEFSDDSGRTYAMAELAGSQFVVLRYKPAQLAAA